MIVEGKRRAVKRLRHVVDASGERDSIRKRAVLYAAKGVAAGDERDHLSLVEALASERGRVAVEGLLGLRDSRRTCLGRVNTPTAEWDRRTTAMGKSLLSRIWSKRKSGNRSYHCSIAVLAPSASMSATTFLMSCRPSIGGREKLPPT